MGVIGHVAEEVGGRSPVEGSRGRHQVRGADCTCGQAARAAVVATSAPPGPPALRVLYVPFCACSTVLCVTYSLSGSRSAVLCIGAGQGQNFRRLGDPASPAPSRGSACDQGHTVKVVDFHWQAPKRWGRQAMKRSRQASRPWSTRPHRPDARCCDADRGRGCVPRWHVSSRSRTAQSTGERAAVQPGCLTQWPGIPGPAGGPTRCPCRM